MLEVNKKYFEYCESIDWKYNEIVLFAGKNKLSLEDVLSSAKEYAYQNNIYTKIELTKKIMKQVVNDNWLNNFISKSDKRMQIYQKLGSIEDEIVFKIKLDRFCYKYFKSVNYELKRLIPLSKNIDINYKVMYRYAMEYYVYVLGKSVESWDKLVDEARQKRMFDAKKEYLLTFSPESKKFYESLNCENYQDYYSKLPKYCYEYSKSVENDVDIIRNHAALIGIPYRDFRDYASIYAIDVLNEKPIRNHKTKELIKKFNP